MTPTAQRSEKYNAQLPDELKAAEAHNAEMLASEGAKRDLRRAIRGGALDNIPGPSPEVGKAVAERAAAPPADDGLVNGRRVTNKGFFDGSQVNGDPLGRAPKFKQNQPVVLKDGPRDAESGRQYHDARGTIHGTPYFDERAGEARYAMVTEDGSVATVKESQIDRPKAEKGAIFIGALTSVSDEQWDRIFGKKERGCLRDAPDGV